LVPIQPGEGRPALFCVHPAGGSVLCYTDLARCLGPGQPVYGLQGPDPRGEREPLEDAVEMAALYVEALRRVQPREPYFLAGYSFGGLIAFEMGQQLQRAGHQVALLALLDTGYPQNCGIRSDGGLIHDLSDLLERHNFGEQMLEEEEYLVWQDLKQLAEKFLASTKEQPQKKRRLRGLGPVQEFLRLHRLLPVEANIGYSEFRHYMRYLRANFRTARKYQPTATHNPITFFRATESILDEPNNPARRIDLWSTLSRGSFEAHLIPGHHLNMLAPPAVESLAAQLRTCIDRALNGQEDN
jgi:thioesterase domain-containing protein